MGTPIRRQRVMIAIWAVTIAMVGLVGLGSEEAEGAANVFSGTTPRRLVDTRNGMPRGRMSSGQVMTINVGTSKPVSLDTVAVQPTGDGYLTLFPCGSPVPNTSSVNLKVGSDVANSSIISPNTRGEVCLYSFVTNRGSVDVVVDLYGTFSSEFRGQVPERLIDTRMTGSRNRVRPDDDLAVLAGDANEAVALNVTITQPATVGHATVYPCSRPRPETSNVNFEAGEDRAGFALVYSGTGAVCVHTSTPAHVIIDKMGAVQRSADDEFFAPQRLMDTRTNYGRFNGSRGRRFSLDLTSMHSTAGTRLQARQRAVALNVTAVNPSGDGFVTVYPCGGGLPANVSALNFAAGRSAAANSVIIQPDRSNRVCFYSNVDLDLVVDLSGYLNRGVDGPIECGEIPGALAEVNRWRRAAGAPNLQFDQAAYTGAVWWAKKMLQDDLFRHSTAAEAQAAGLEKRFSEVIADGTDIDVWRTSPPHYRILTSPGSRRAAFASCDYTRASGQRQTRAVGWITV